MCILPSKKMPLIYCFCRQRLLCMSTQTCTHQETVAGSRILRSCNRLTSQLHFPCSYLSQVVAEHLKKCISAVYLRAEKTSFLTPPHPPPCSPTKRVWKEAKCYSVHELGLQRHNDPHWNASSAIWRHFELEPVHIYQILVPCTVLYSGHAQIKQSDWAVQTRGDYKCMKMSTFLAPENNQLSPPVWVSCFVACQFSTS